MSSNVSPTRVLQDRYLYMRVHAKNFQKRSNSRAGETILKVNQVETSFLAWGNRGWLRWGTGFEKNDKGMRGAASIHRGGGIHGRNRIGAIYDRDGQRESGALEQSANPSFTYGYGDDNAAPTTISTAGGIPFSPGGTVTVTYVSGQVNVFPEGGYPATDANGATRKCPPITL